MTELQIWPVVLLPLIGNVYFSNFLKKSCFKNHIPYLTTFASLKLIDIKQMAKLTSLLVRCVSRILHEDWETLHFHGKSFHSNTFNKHVWHSIVCGSNWNNVITVIKANKWDKNSEEQQKLVVYWPWSRLDK